MYVLFGQQATHSRDQFLETVQVDVPDSPLMCHPECESGNRLVRSRLDPGLGASKTERVCESTLAIVRELFLHSNTQDDRGREKRDR